MTIKKQRGEYDQVILTDELPRKKRKSRAKQTEDFADENMQDEYQTEFAPDEVARGSATRHSTRQGFSDYTLDGAHLSSGLLREVQPSQSPFAHSPDVQSQGSPLPAVDYESHQALSPDASGEPTPAPQGNSYPDITGVGNFYDYLASTLPPGKQPGRPASSARSPQEFFPYAPNYSEDISNTTPDTPFGVLVAGNASVPRGLGRGRRRSQRGRQSRGNRRARRT